MFGQFVSETTIAALETTLNKMRAAIHQAEGPWQPPYGYMNYERPLTPLALPSDLSEAPSRLVALRHTLHLLEKVEQLMGDLKSTDGVTQLGAVIMATGVVGMVSGLLLAHGIDPQISEDKVAA